MSVEKNYLQLKAAVAFEDLNLSDYYVLTVERDKVSCQGHFNMSRFAKLLSKGFKSKRDEEWKWIILTKGKIRVTLV